MNNKLIFAALAILSCGVEAGAMMTGRRTPQVARQTGRPTGAVYGNKMTPNFSARGAQGSLRSSMVTTPHAGRTSVRGEFPSRGTYSIRTSGVAPYAQRGITGYSVDSRPARVGRTGGLSDFAGRRAQLASIGRDGAERASLTELGSQRRGVSLPRDRYSALSRTSAGKTDLSRTAGGRTVPSGTALSRSSAGKTGLSRTAGGRTVPSGTAAGRTIGARNLGQLSLTTPVRVDANRSSYRIEKQRDFLHKDFGHHHIRWNRLYYNDWPLFISIFPFAYYSVYHEYPPVYYDYYDTYGRYPQKSADYYLILSGQTQSIDDPLIDGCTTACEAGCITECQNVSGKSFEECEDDCEPLCADVCLNDRDEV